MFVYGRDILGDFFYKFWEKSETKNFLVDNALIIIYKTS